MIPPAPARKKVKTRFKVIHLIIAVFVSALLSNAYIWYVKAREYRMKAEYFAKEERSARSSADLWEEMSQLEIASVERAVHRTRGADEQWVQRTVSRILAQDDEGRGNNRGFYAMSGRSQDSMRKRLMLFRERLAHHRRLAEYYAEMRHKYHRASLSLWFPLKPDPPEFE
jgi:hypothetical protein